MLSGMSARNFAMALVALAAVAPSIASAQQLNRYGKANAITESRLKAHLEFIAHDLLEGRNAPSLGHDLAVEYVATQLKLWGVKPAGPNGSYFQAVPFGRNTDTNPKPGTGKVAHNVIAVIEGSDPKLKDEYVAIGAHIDHDGVRPQAQGDKIWNGADDDGSGTVAMLEIAHALATGPRPRRSVLLVWHTAEEKGLIGSKYFVDHPTVPLDKIVAMMNIDMIGRSKMAGDSDARNRMLTGPDSVYVIGSNKLSTDLGNLVKAANDSLYKLTLDYHYDRPNDPEQLYYRSDHYNYAAKGIPIAFFFDGVHVDYHQASDHADKIDYRKLHRITQTIFGATWLVADRVQRPRIDGKN